MSSVTTSPRRALPSDKITLVFSVLGIAVTLLTFMWFIGTAFSICALGVLIVSRRRQSLPITPWTRAAVALIVIGILLQAAIALFFMPAYTDVTSTVVRVR